MSKFKNVKKQILKKTNYHSIFLFNVLFFVFSVVFSFRYLSSVLIEFNMVSLFYLCVYFFAQGFVLFLLFFLLSRILFLLTKNKLIHGLFSSFFSCFITAYLYLDSKIFFLYKYHINIAIVKIYADPAEFATMELTVSDILFFCSIVLILFMLFFLIFYVVNYYENRINFFKKQKSKSIFMTFLVICFIAEKSMLLYAAAVQDRRVSKFSSLLPFHFEIRSSKINPFVQSLLPIDKMKIHSIKGFLNYPIGNPSAKISHSYNVIYLVLESWNTGFLNEKVMPHTLDFAKNSLYFTNNMSGGIATRFGIFSLFYGVGSNTWVNFVLEKKPPFLMEVLKQNNYDFLVQMSAALNSPEFDKTVFSNVSSKDMIDTNKLPDLPVYKKDEIIKNNLIHFMSKRVESGNKNPFFAFTFFDSSHSGYVFPDNDAKFKNYIQNTYRNVDDLSKLNLIKTRYANSLSYEDTLLEEIFAYLKTSGLIDSTIVILAGDHGEEFYEYGYYGHNGAFTSKQMGTPLVIHYPNVKAKEISRLTSHYDVPATILDLLGNKAPATSYSLGSSLLSEDPKTFRHYAFACSINYCGTRTNDMIYVFGNNEQYMWSFSTVDLNYRDLPKNSELAKKNTLYLRQSLVDMSAFY